MATLVPGHVVLSDAAMAILMPGRVLLSDTAKATSV